MTHEDPGLNRATRAAQRLRADSILSAAQKEAERWRLMRRVTVAAAAVSSIVGVLFLGLLVRSDDATTVEVTGFEPSTMPSREDVPQKGGSSTSPPPETSTSSPSTAALAPSLTDTPSPDRYEVEADGIYFVAKGDRNLIHTVSGIVVDVTTRPSRDVPSGLVYEVIENGCDRSIHSVSPTTSDTVLEPEASLPAVDGSGTLLAFVRVSNCARTAEVIVRDLNTGVSSLVADFGGADDGPRVEIRDLAIAGTTLTVLLSANDGIPIYEEARLFSVMGGPDRPLIDQIGALDQTPGATDEWTIVVALDDSLIFGVVERGAFDQVGGHIQSYDLGNRSVTAQFSVSGSLVSMSQDRDSGEIYFISVEENGDRTLNVVDSSGEPVSTSLTALSHIVIAYDSVS